MTPAVDARAALAALWRDAALDPAALDSIDLPGTEPAMPSSFPVATMAQASLAAAALAAAELGRARIGDSGRQRVSVDLVHAALEARNAFRLDATPIEIRDRITGLHRARDGWVRIHANFTHHRDGALALLGLPTGTSAGPADVEAALRDWDAIAFEDAAAERGLVVVAARSFAQWDRHPQALALAGMPAMTIRPIAGCESDPPRDLPALSRTAGPLDSLRVIELTRILAGPVAGRTLAAYGADVMLVNSPRLPNIDSIAETSRGKRSVHLELDHWLEVERLRALVADAHVFMQGYRPGALAARGFGPQHLASMRPGIVCTNLSAYGFDGPWSQRRGFDSLVQTASGLNDAEAEAFGESKPRPFPMQILDYTAGFLMAFGTSAALLRQHTQGGSWEVRVSLAGVATWLRSLGRIDGRAVALPSLEPFLEHEPSGFGLLTAVRHAAVLERTPASYRRPSMPPGTDLPVW